MGLANTDDALAVRAVAAAADIPAPRPAAAQAQNLRQLTSQGPGTIPWVSRTMTFPASDLSA